MLQGGPFEMRVQLLIGETGSRRALVWLYGW